MGDTAVGKSCILKRFVDDEFEEGLLSTIGVDFRFRKLKINNNDNVKLQIWDTAGLFWLLIQANRHFEQ